VEEAASRDGSTAFRSVRSAVATSSRSAHRPCLVATGRSARSCMSSPRVSSSLPWCCLGEESISSSSTQCVRTVTRRPGWRHVCRMWDNRPGSRGTEPRSNCKQSRLDGTKSRMATAAMRDNTRRFDKELQPDSAVSARRAHSCAITTNTNSVIY
jgi:hypothetical protein